VATTTLVELIEQTRLKANVSRSNFVTDAEVITYLNEARKQLREEIISADDSYYQATLDFSISAQPSNVQALPDRFWKMRGLDAFAGDSLRQREVYAREYRNRFDAGVGYYFGGTGTSIVVCGQSPEQCNPFRLTYVPRPLPLALLLEGNTRSITHDAADGTNAGAHFIFTNGAFTPGDVGATVTISGAANNNGTYTILSITGPIEIAVLPAPTPSLLLGAGAVVSIADADNATRSFNVAPTDNQNSGYWVLQNGAFGASDVGSYLTTVINAPNEAYSGTFQILTVVNSTAVQVTPTVTPASGSLTGTATLSRQPANTESALDLTEDGFSEYLSVRAGMAVARKKRQDSLLAQLAAERAAIEGRIQSLSRMRQSEPQQAPVLWGRRSISYDDWEV